MTKLAARSVLGTVWLISLALPLAAQTLEEGVRNGSFVQPDGAVETVTFDISYPAGELAITMREDGGEVSFDGGEVSFYDARVDDGSLLFSWKTGDVVISCSLERLDDGGYEGECQQPGGAVMGRMTMAPEGS